MNWLNSIKQFFSGYGNQTLKTEELDELLLDTRRISLVIKPVIYVCLIALAITCGWKNFAAGLVWAFACLSIGFFFGFLFGIPKVQQREQTRGANNPANKRYQQKVNTNLEDISDWITKIIVGLGLYQLSNIPIWIDKLAVLFATSVGNEEQKHGVFGAAIIFFLVCGFLLGYLLTRLYLQGALGRADIGAVPVDESELPKEKAEDLIKDEPDTDNT